MSALDARNVLRPRTGLVGAIMGLGLKLLPPLFAAARRIWPIPHIGKLYAVTLYDDVIEVFGTDSAFGVTYHSKLDLLMGGEPFMLGLSDGPEYRAAIAALRSVFLADDLPVLAGRVEAQAAAIVADAGGTLEVVDALVRRVTFDFVADYLGISSPAPGDLRVWATRMFEYQFVASDAALVAEVREIAPALRAHIDGDIARRKASGEARDDILGRSLAKQAAGDPWFTEANIRTALMGMIVGGPPQPPMVVPQAMEQLLRRPEALAGAQAAARAGDDAALRGYVMEAMRFDPLGPALPRVVLRDATVAAGTSRAKTVPAGATVFACFQSAMMDSRRIEAPSRFVPDRPDAAYIHFGHGLHECFGRYINHATLHLMLKPLLARPNLRRASGRSGRLRKAGAFAEALTVRYD